MKHLILGTAGHIDHGKTALVRALTGVDTDRLPEEKRRGITIDLGFAELVLADDIHIGIVDVPGHENFVRNMLAGATGIDLGLLVVAADEGVMPQTREHLAILEFAGIRDLVVAITKSDLVERDWCALVRDDIADLLSASRFTDTPMVLVSATTGAGLDELRETLSTRARQVQTRSRQDLLRLPIDRVFTVRGTGTVVTGTLWSGSVSRDQTVMAMPGDLKVRVRAVQVHGNDCEAAAAGQRTALALAGTDRSELGRGDVLVDAGGWDAAMIVTVRLRVLPDASALNRGQRIRFHLGTAELSGRVIPYAGTSIEPGEEDHAQIRLEAPVVARTGDPFVIRSWSPIATVGGGRIIEPAAGRRKRLSPTVRRQLDTILDGQPRDAVAAATALKGWIGLPIDLLPLRTRLPPDQAAAAAHAPDCPVTLVGSVLFHDRVIQQAAARIVNRLEAFHAANSLAPGLSREQLRQAVPSPNGSLADHVMDGLVTAGVIDVDGSLIRLVAHTPSLDADQVAASRAIADVYVRAELASPTHGDLPPGLAGRADIDDLLHFLVRSGDLVQLAPGRYITADAAAGARSRVRDELAGRTDLSPSDFRNLFGISRKYLLPLLEWLDRNGVTVRQGELRSVPRLQASHQERTP